MSLLSVRYTKKKIHQPEKSSSQPDFCLELVVFCPSQSVFLLGSCFNLLVMDVPDGLAGVEGVDACLGVREAGVFLAPS